MWHKSLFQRCCLPEREASVFSNRLNKQAGYPHRWMFIIVIINMKQEKETLTYCYYLCNQFSTSKAPLTSNTEFKLNKINRKTLHMQNRWFNISKNAPGQYMVNIHTSRVGSTFNHTSSLCQKSPDWHCRPSNPWNLVCFNLPGCSLTCDRLHFNL